ncbi:MAG: hypothetical protein V5A33_04750 [Halobacteriales archaeon]
MTARFDSGRSVTDRLGRRRFLAGTAGVLVALAGCTESDDGGDGTDPSTEGDQGTPTGGTRANGETATPGATTDGSTAADGNGTASDGGTTVNKTTDEDDLDLREANVVEVAFDGQDGTVTFEVTLYHDDDGEAEYANWWQVERLDGERLGRRELLHAHSTAPFTRSERIDVPDDVACVVVRGHDQLHEYGGQAALVNLESGEKAFVRQGSERQSFDAADCP